MGRDAVWAARDAPVRRPDDELFFHYERVGLLT